MIAFLLVIVLAIAVGVPAYLRLLALLRDRHGDVYRALGSPTLGSRSPRRSLALQRFIYGPEPARLGDPDLLRVVKLLRLYLPVMLAALLLTWALWLLELGALW